MIYQYTMKGTAASGQSWETNGSIEIEPRDFPDIGLHAMFDSFQKLTQGKAVFGKPGVGCDGPYRIDELSVKAE